MNFDKMRHNWTLHEKTSVSIPAVLLLCCVTMGKLLDLTELAFPEK